MTCGATWGRLIGAAWNYQAGHFIFQPGHLVRPRHRTQLLDVITAAPEEAATRSPRGLVLLAGDNSANRKVAVTQLARLGYAVRIAEDGRQAFEMCRAAPPVWPQGRMIMWANR